MNNGSNIVVKTFEAVTNKNTETLFKILACPYCGSKEIIVKDDTYLFGQIHQILLTCDFCKTLYSDFYDTKTGNCVKHTADNWSDFMEKYEKRDKTIPFFYKEEYIKKPINVIVVAPSHFV